MGNPPHDVKELHDVDPDFLIVTVPRVNSLSFWPSLLSCTSRFFIPRAWIFTETIVFEPDAIRDSSWLDAVTLMDVTQRPGFGAPHRMMNQSPNG